MVNKIIIADAGSLIAFSKIKRLSLITEILGTIIAPHFVLDECLANPAQEGAKEISAAIDKNLIVPHKNPEISHYKNLFDILGPGEASAIILASQLKFGLLIDEKLGRRTAQKMSLKIIGTAGVLLLAKEKKLIEKVSPVLQDLKKCGYYLSKELIQLVLDGAKE